MGAALHEAGHVIAGIAYGATIQQIRVGPALIVYPTVALGTANLDMGEVKQSAPKSRKEAGAWDLAGSGLTATVAIVILAVLRAVAKSTLFRISALAASLILAWDIVSYSIFPLLGWRHWIVLGGTDPEPLLGADLLGVARWMYYFALAVYVVAIHWLAITVSRKRRP